MPTEAPKQDGTAATGREASELNDLLCAFEELLHAAVDYVEYEHNGDPWIEDARTMGEMELDDLKRNGRLAEYRGILAKFKEHNGSLSPRPAGAERSGEV